MMKRKILALATAVLTCVFAYAGPVTLDNGHVRLQIGEDGSLQSMAQDGREVLPEGGSATALWKLELLGPMGEDPVYLPDYARFRGVSADASGRSAVLEWEINIDRSFEWTVKVQVSLPEGSDLPLWSIGASLPEGFVVKELEFPRISVARLRESRLIVSAGYGAEYKLPAGASVESRYPSVTGGMEMVMVHGGEGCVYFAAQDREGCGKYFTVSGTDSALTLVQRIPTSFAWTSGGEFNLPWETTLAFRNGTWEEAALEWYRPFTFTTQWGATTLKDRYIVPWVAAADVWIRPKNVFPEVVEALRKAVAYYGEGTGVHWYHWHHNDYDTLYPEYFPAREGFTDLVAEMQAAGAHVTPYTNGRLWDPANDWYTLRHGYEASCRKLDGSLYTEIYPTSNVINTVTCPGSPIWQELVAETTLKVRDTLGTHGIYIDQVGAAASEPCYARNHDHAPGAGGWWPAAYRRILGDIRTRVDDPDWAITTEEDAECYIDLFDMMLIVNTPHSADVRMVPLFPLVYSDRCVYSGLNYYHQQLNDGHFLYNNARSLLWGSQLGWIQPEWLMAEGNEVEIEFLKTLGDFRSGQHDLFMGGRFLRELALKGRIPEVKVMNDEVFPTVMASEWESVDGTHAILLVNYGPRARRVRIPGFGRVRVPAYDAIRINIDTQI